VHSASDRFKHGLAAAYIVLNTKAIYAAGGGIAVAAVVIFFVLGANPSPSSPGVSPSTNNNSTATTRSVLPPLVNVKDISVTKVDNTHANVQVTFTVKNTNNSTLVLETIHYNVNVDGLHMTIGDVGESAQGFLDSQGNLFPIVSGSTLTAKDTQVVERTGAIASAWDKMVAGTAHYSIDGTYSYRVTGATMQTTAEDKDFKLTFP
jgi:archaellum component FlaG (FlaF/FlaG flagellin family)